MKAHTHTHSCIYIQTTNTIQTVQAPSQSKLYPSLLRWLSWLDSAKLAMAESLWALHRV